MNLRKLIFKTTTVSFLVSAALLLSICMVYAGDKCQLIRIEMGKGGAGSRLEIFPQNITVPVGACTVWINFVQRGEVQVSFRENAKVCKMSTEASQGFDLSELKNGESCYISEKLPRGKTASLVWTKPGIYKYTLDAPAAAVGSAVKLHGGDIMAEGIIEVQ